MGRIELFTPLLTHAGRKGGFLRSQNLFKMQGVASLLVSLLQNPDLVIVELIFLLLYIALLFAEIS
jgi:hypothetical protein